jgi:hypothetical protein
MGGQGGPTDMIRARKVKKTRLGMAVIHSMQFNDKQVKRPVAHIGKILMNGRWFTLIPSTFHTYTDARVHKTLHDRAGGCATAVVPANFPWVGWPIVWIRMVWVLFREWYIKNKNWTGG